MLTEDDKKRIREEEIYRQEIRQQLEGEKPTLSRRLRLWEAVNKPFVLWSLSTILVGLISLAYTTREAQKKEQSQRREAQNKERSQKKDAINKIDREIRNRISGSLKYLDNPSKDGQPIKPDDMFQAVFLYLDKNTGEHAVVLHAELLKEGFQALVTDLKGLVSVDEQQDLDNALNAYDELSSSRTEANKVNTNRSKPNTTEESKVSAEAIKSAKELIRERIMIPRWKS